MTKTASVRLPAICAAPGCDYPRPDFQFVCTNCERVLSKDLTEAPALLIDLDVSMAKLDKIGATPGPGGKGAEQPLPFKPAASEAKWVLANVITTWSRDLADHEGIVVAWTDNVAAARWLLVNRRSLAMHPAAGEAVDEIAAAVANAMRAVDYPVDNRVYLGMCGDVAGLTGCRGKVYAGRQANIGSCDFCRKEHDARHRRTLMLRAMANKKITAAEIATVLARLGVEITVKDIQDHAKAGRLVAQGQDAHRRRAYFVGDVLRLFLGPGSLSA